MPGWLRPKKNEVVQDPAAFANFDESLVEEEARALVDSIVSAIEQVKNELGVGSSNGIMANILINTEEALNASTIAFGFTDALRKIQNESAVDKNSKNNPDSSAKLEKLLEFFNGTDEEGKLAEDRASAAADQPDTPQAMADKSASPLRLSEALNQYFEVEDSNRKPKIFTEDLQWGYERSESLNPDLSVQAMGQENIDLIIDHIRKNYDNEEAVQYLEDLSDEDNFFDAIETVANMLGVEQLPASQQLSHRDHFAKFLNDGAEEYGGLEAESNAARFKEGKFIDYLNSTVTDMVNDALNSNQKLKNDVDFKKSVMDKGTTMGMDKSTSLSGLSISVGGAGDSYSLLGDDYLFNGWSAGADLGDSRTLVTSWKCSGYVNHDWGASGVTLPSSEAMEEMKAFKERVSGLTAEERLANYDDLMQTYDEIWKKFENEHKVWQDQIVPVRKFARAEYQTKTGALVSKIA